MQRGLLLGRGERPGRARAALLAEDEAQLLRRFELGLVGTEGRARLRQLERAEQVDAEVALLAADLRRGPPVWAAACSCLLLRLRLPPALTLELSTGRSDQSTSRGGPLAARISQIAEKIDSRAPER